MKSGVKILIATLAMTHLALAIVVGAPKSDPTARPNGETVEAQKIVKTEHGHISVGILMPDRGMADPHVWLENGRLYVMCGHDKSWEPVNTWIMNRWDLWSTDNLTTWKHEYSIDPTDTYIGDQPNCWAGDICERNGKYYWFFSNRNLNSGVMIADKITGPYKDLLGKPLLTPDMAKTHPYDPEIYIENGEYHICFGAGTYYMARLAEDMKSLIEKPRMISVVDKDGKKIGMGDKPAMFKRGDWYYLVSGGRYAMSKELYGPYNYVGNFGGGGHNSFFVWKGQWYVIHELGDTNIFYRGVGLQPLYFRENGEMHLAKTRAVHPGAGRDYNFNVSQMGWHVEEGETSFSWNEKGYIEGAVKSKEASVSSAIYLLNSMKYNNTLSFKLKNETSSKRVRVSLATYDDARFVWNVYPIQADWSQHTYVDIDVKPNSKKWETYTVDLTKMGLKVRLMQIKISPAMDAKSGKWALDDVVLSKQ